MEELLVAARGVLEAAIRDDAPTKEDDPAFHEWIRLRRAQIAGTSSGESAVGAECKRPGSSKRKSTNFQKFSEAHRQWREAGRPMDAPRVPVAGGLSGQMRRLRRAAFQLAAQSRKAGS